MDCSRPFLLAAVHKGPYLSLQPLETELGPAEVIYLVEGVSRQERMQMGLPYLDLAQVQQGWGSLETFLDRTQTKAIIRSSSEDVAERNVEELASRAARETGIPVFVVEDFPGNYWPKPDERLDGLFVEDGSLVKLHQGRGVVPQLIHIAGNPRYSIFTQIDRKRRREQARRDLSLDNEPVMLWAGQPDGDNSYLSLARVLRHFDYPQVTLLFRAHPRDSAYQTGKYRELLTSSRMKVKDVSQYPDLLSLYCASDLVVTQFSSAGAEASHLGVPALFVLFEDLGKKYLRTFKGYDTLPWTHAGAAFLIEQERDICDIMERALFDRQERRQVIARFQKRFPSNQAVAQTIARIIKERSLWSIPD